MQPTNGTIQHVETVSAKTELGNLGVKDIFFKYIRFLPLFILSLAIALLGAYIYLRYATPIYRSAGTLLIKSQPRGKGQGDEKLNQLFLNEGTQNIQNEIEVLKSKPLMQRVVDSLHLQVNYFAVGKIKSPNIYKQGPFLMEVVSIPDSNRSFTLNIHFSSDNLFSVNNSKQSYAFGEAFKTEYGIFKLIKNNYSGLGKEYNVTWEPTYAAAGKYASLVQVTPKPNTGILTLTLETTNPQLSADIINVLMNKYGEWTKEDKQEEAFQTLKFIQIRLDKLQQEVDSLQRVILDYKVANNLISPDAQTENYFNSMIESDKITNQQTLQFNIAEMIENYLASGKNKNTTIPVLVPSPLTVQDITLNALIGQYNSLQLKRKDYIDAGVPANNPLVTEQDQAIENLRAKILENLANVKKAINLTITNSRKIGNVAESQIKIMPAKVKKLAEMQTLLDSKMELYKFLITKKEETSISVASTTPNSQAIDQAYASYTPVKPNRRAVQMLAILIGIGLPALFIFMLEVINDKITTRYDIEKITQAPVLGEIGHSFADSPLVVSKTNRGMVAEQFRIIRSNLQYVLNKIPKSVILVTSSFSGEGKSFITINMGAVMALAGKKTIVLEFDIRKPKILTGLEMGKNPGITNFLLGKANIEDLPVLIAGYENFYVLPCGPVPPNPSEMLLDTKVTELFNWLKANFDVVLIDTAPVGMVGDAMTLGQFANCTLYIVRQGYTYKKQIALIDEFYREAKLPKVSIVINDVKIKPGYGYYGYGRYGYGYGDNSGYYEEEHPPANSFERLLKRFTSKKRKRTKA